MKRKLSNKDGTDKLCEVLYGEVKAQYYIGGSDAKMLHDGANEIQRLRMENTTLVYEINVALESHIEEMEVHIESLIGKMSDLRQFTNDFTPDVQDMVDELDDVVKIIREERSEFQKAYDKASQDLDGFTEAFEKAKEMRNA